MKLVAEYAIIVNGEIQLISSEFYFDVPKNYLSSTSVYLEEDLEVQFERMYEETFNKKFNGRLTHIHDDNGTLYFN